MGRVLRCVVIASIAFASKASAQADVNLRDILVALTNDARIRSQVVASGAQAPSATAGGTLTPPGGPTVMLPGVLQPRRLP